MNICQGRMASLGQGEIGERVEPFAPYGVLGTTIWIGTPW